MSAAPYPDFDGSQPCATTDPEMFFPEQGNTSAYTVEVTTAICESCPFIEPCAAYALTHNVDGIWAGMTERERARKRRKLGIRLPSEPLVASAANREMVLRMAGRGTPPPVIAAVLEVHPEWVLRVLREARAAARDDVA